MDAKKNLNENDLFPINDDSEKHFALKKLKKHINDANDNTEGESTGSTTDTNRPDLRLTTVTNGSDDQIVETGTELSNTSLHLQLQSSLKMITNIKQCIGEYENMLIANLPEKLLENQVDFGSYKDFTNLKRKDDSFVHSDERKKRKISRDDQDYMLREKNESRDLLVQYKKKINMLEKELSKKTTAKKTSNYISQSDTEYEDESDTSVYNVQRQKTSHNRHPKKNIKRSRGRPRKTIVMDDQISNSISEHREKKSRGRPRKSVIRQDSSALNEFHIKNSRGRPRKTVLAKDQSSTSINEEKLESDNEKSDFNSKKNESINSFVVGKRSRGRPKKRSTVTTKLENASNIEINEIDAHEKTLNIDEQKVRRSRGRPKSTKKVTPNKPTDTNFKTVHRGRGRPKKNKPVSDEDATPIS